MSAHDDQCRCADCFVAMLYREPPLTPVQRMRWEREAFGSGPLVQINTYGHRVVVRDAPYEVPKTRIGKLVDFVTAPFRWLR